MAPVLSCMENVRFWADKLMPQSASRKRSTHYRFAPVAGIGMREREGLSPKWSAQCVPPPAGK